MAAIIRGTAKTDSREWSIAIDHLAVLIEEYTKDASLDAAELISAITKAKLAERSHGPLSFSPSPRGAGQPPAMVSGALAASITAASGPGTSAMVGPTGGYIGSENRDTKDYARIQELGGDMHGDPYMRFVKAFPGGGRGTFKIVRNGQVIFSGPRRGTNGAHVQFIESFVRLTPRPYLRPSTEEAVDSGRVRDIYARWWADAIEQGAG